MENLSDKIQRKFIESYNIDDYEIETDSGFVDIEKLLVTIEYEKYYLKTKNGLELFCADNHIIFDENFNEKFVVNLKKGDKIITKNGLDIVDEIFSCNENENMYDLQLNDKSNHRYYTNDILSHNTLLAKKIAEEIFGSSKELVRIDMSEYSEKNSTAKLIGAAPGYVGYENGGQLTEAIKNKQHCVLLLDEIEKANEEIYNLFLQLFDEGQLTDSSGNIVNFKNVIVLMTSNIGAKQSAELGKGMGFVNDENSNKQNIIKKELRKTFTPEFINRIDQIVYFNQLTNDNLKNIIILELKKLNKRLNELSLSIDFNDDVINFLLDKAIKDKDLGARPIIRLIQDYIEDNITELLLINNYDKNYVFKISIDDGKIRII